MKLPRDVMNDLLTVYLAGQASDETRALVEAYAREDEEFAAAMHAAARDDIRPAADQPGADLEIRSLKMTREFVRLRSLLMGAAIFFTTVPFSCMKTAETGFRWIVWGTSPALGYAFLSLGALSWVAWYAMNQRVKRAGL